MPRDLIAPAAPPSPGDEPATSARSEGAGSAGPDGAGVPSAGSAGAGARAWAALADAHALVTDRLGLALLDATGLGITEFEVLLRIDGVPPPGTRLGALQPAIRLSQPTLSRMAARLEQRGLLRRAGDPTDRRGIVLTITPTGRRTLRRAAAVHARTLQSALLDPLAPDGHAQLTHLLHRIAEDRTM